MPLGFQNRFTYGDIVRNSGSISSGPWNWSGRPLLGYDAVYTYRSGKRAKELSDGANSTALLRSGSLADQMRRRTEYLNEQIRDNLTPSTGSTAAFSCSGDTGHPFATYKWSTTKPYAHYSFNRSGVGTHEVDVNLAEVVPVPNFSDPFGAGFVNELVSRRFTYFSWPATGGYLNRVAPSVSNQLISNAVKNSIGSGVIAGANPWAPKASLAQTILELMSGDVPRVLLNLRKYVQNMQSLKRTVGSDWLNVQFGWVPLANDIRDTIETLFKLHMLLHGSDSRRRSRGGDIGTWARTTETTYSNTLTFGSPLNSTSTAPPFMSELKGTGSIGFASSIPAGVGKFSRSCRVEADFRFTGKYHRGAQPNGRERSYIDQAAELLGLELTPAVLWELAPWTWLLDWGSNLGSIAANISQLDWSNVLLDYAYLTTVVKTTSSVIWQGPQQLNSFSRLSHGYIAHGYTSEEKIREQASPYGFSVSWDGLSPFQLSILAALGMSRGR